MAQIHAPYMLLICHQIRQQLATPVDEVSWCGGVGSGSLRLGCFRATRLLQKPCCPLRALRVLQSACTACRRPLCQLRASLQISPGGVVQSACSCGLAVLRLACLCVLPTCYAQACVQACQFSFLKGRKGTWQPFTLHLQAMSMGVHESQSLLWERMVALQPPFSKASSLLADHAHCGVEHHTQYLPLASAHCCALRDEAHASLAAPNHCCVEQVEGHFCAPTCITCCSRSRRQAPDAT